MKIIELTQVGGNQKSVFFVPQNITSFYQDDEARCTWVCTQNSRTGVKEATDEIRSMLEWVK